MKSQKVTRLTKISWNNYTKIITEDKDKPLTMLIKSMDKFLKYSKGDSDD